MMKIKQFLTYVGVTSFLQFWLLLLPTSSIVYFIFIFILRMTVCHICVVIVIVTVIVIFIVGIVGIVVVRDDVRSIKYIGSIYYVVNSIIQFRIVPIEALPYYLGLDHFENNVRLEVHFEQI